MTHFVALAIVRPAQQLDELLAPFDEALDVEPYRYDSRHWRTVLASADAFIREQGGRPTGDIAGRLADWDGGIWREEDGEYVRYSTYNPRSLWDWWMVGGRWTGAHLPEDRGTVGQYLDLMEADENRIPPRVVFHDGEAEEQGEQGWFGYSKNDVEDEGWRERILNLLRSHPRTDQVVFLDLHI